MTDADVNMYGFTPCPKCGSKYRCSFNNAPTRVDCDDCGFREPITVDNYIFFDKNTEAQSSDDGA